MHADQTVLLPVLSQARSANGDSTAVLTNADSRELHRERERTSAMTADKRDARNRKLCQETNASKNQG
jgi:hypothetical protein